MEGGRHIRIHEELRKKLEVEDMLPQNVGAYRPPTYRGEIVGAVLKSKEGCNPIFISPGNRISLETSIE